MLVVEVPATVVVVDPRLLPSFVVAVAESGVVVALTVVNDDDVVAVVAVLGFRVVDV